jgi:hypothetical protein
MKDDNISPELEAALDTNIAWIIEVTTDYQARGHIAIKEALERTTPEEKDSLLRVLLMIQSGAIAELRRTIREQLVHEHLASGNGGAARH